jgi:Na+-translocating ferredoxin:NAD+ oxidoreductase RnfG subunit
MDVEQAQRLLIPQAALFASVSVVMGDAELATLARQTETSVPKRFSPKVWEGQAAGKGLGWVMLDRVVGKYDLIDYAVGFDRDARILGVEVLVYRESHGAEIRQTNWRAQFKGRQGPQALRFADEIRNISGATLSCQHVTEGVQRLSVMAGWLKATG